MKRWIPTREQLRRIRWLKPLAHHFDHEHLWRTDRASVARAVSIGVFVGLLLPVAQFIVAIAIAIALRSHIAIAAACTLVTNPLTFAPIYWAAYKIGDTLLGGELPEDEALRIETQATELADQQGFIEGVLYSLQAAGAPLVLGLVVLAVLGAMVGFSLVWLLWRPEPQPPAG